jgi:alpha-L-rhamnosidase
MNLNRSLLSAISLLCFVLIANANPPQVNPELMERTWPARWVANIDAKHNPRVQGVFLFRKSIELDHIDGDFIVHVSADNRYEFYVNGIPVGRGPAQSVPAQWNFETYNIAPLLQTGKNVLAARVWNWGNFAPWAQRTIRTGLIVQGNSDREQIVNTGNSWKQTQDHSWEFFNYTPEEFHHTTGVGPCEKIDASRMIVNWNMPGFDDREWLFAEEMFPGQPAVMGTRGYTWGLKPRITPQMEGSVVRLKKVSRWEGVEVDEQFCTGKAPFTIPANSKATILFDNHTLTVAIPRLTVDKGKGSQIKITYNEALYDQNRQKQHRDRIDGMHISGYYDVFLPDGTEKIFQTLWNRTYRYLQIDITTSDEPLIIKDYHGILDIYPFELKASFSSSDPYLEKIFDAGWLTARTCALENYVDCPYYEQLQYFGDLNISNMITVLLSGDTRLMRNAILQGKYSITEEGLTLAAAPCIDAKIIPFFSIAWIGMIYNYWTYTANQEFVESLLPDIEGVLNWYRARINDTWMLGPMSHWNFVDCTQKWPWAPERGSVCEPTGTREGNSSILTLQYVYGLQLAQKLYFDLGQYEKAREYERLAGLISDATYRLCWDETRHRMADVPDRSSYSQHASIFAALSGTVTGDDAKKLLKELYHDDSLLKASTQFQAYFHKALVKHGLASDYLNYIKIWKDLIDMGFTTFPEYPNINPRSDSHAWNAYPAFELFTIICGIQITEPGFGSMIIEPNLGDLEWVKASLPWRDDEIRIDLRKTRRGLRGTINIPEGLKTTYRSNGKDVVLKAGENRI